MSLATSRSLSEESVSVTAPTHFYIPSLDGVRIFAFVTVFVSHVRGNKGGMIGVTVFFFLSGYLITTLLRRENSKNGKISIAQFFLRRVLRIMPPLYLTIGFIVLLVRLHWIAEPISTGSLLAFSTFLGNYWVIFRIDANPALGPMWSLAVEEHFYLVFPLLFLLMNRASLRLRTQATLLGGLAALVFFWRLIIALHPSATTIPHINHGTDTRIDCILFGCIMALVFNPVLDRGMKPPVWLVLLGVAGLIVSVASHNPVYQQTVRYTLQPLALIPIFMALVTRGDTWFAFLNLRWVRYLGTLSYTLYLVHVAFLVLANEHVHSRSLAVFLAATGSFVFAALMNFLVERPLVRFRRRLA